MSRNNQDILSFSSCSLPSARANLARADEMSTEEINALLHDLSVYQFELETQNEQLKHAQQDSQSAKARYFKLYRNIPVGYITLDSLGIIRECNDKFLQLSGREEKRVIGRTLAEFVEMTDRKQFDLWVKSGKRLTTPMTVGFGHRKGERLYVSLLYSEMDGGSDGEDITVVTCTDVTALKVAEDRVRLSAVVFEAASEGTMVTDADQRIILVNPAFTRITGYTAEEVQGRTPKFLNSGKHTPEFYRDFWRDLHTKRHWEGEIWNRKKSGEIYPEWLTVNMLNDHHGELRFYVAVFRDETERKQAEEIIRKQAAFDNLTGLPNRMLFMDRLEQAMRNSHRMRKQMSLLFIDLDGFKEVNDTLGHGAGDLLLKVVARRLQLCVRETDTVARLGGDEFALILSGLDDEDGVNRITDGILKSLADPIQLNGGLSRGE